MVSKTIGALRLGSSNLPLGVIEIIFFFNVKPWNFYENMFF